jgi:hypothetical protein
MVMNQKGVKPAAAMAEVYLPIIACASARFWLHSYMWSPRSKANWGESCSMRATICWKVAAG